MLLQKFSFTETQDVTTLVHPAHGILFDATNVCSILELRDTTSALRRLDDDEKALLKREEYERFPDSASEAESEFDRQKGAKSKWFVTEPGLYTLTLGSEKPQAKAFKRWITHEVIPALRRTGSYTMPNGQANVADATSPIERVAKASGTLPTAIIQKEFAACLAIFTDFTDITGNHAKLAANRLFKQIYQIDILKTAEVDLPSKVQARCWYPTELGKRVGISAMKMNMLLELANLQTSSYHVSQTGRKYKVWTATEEGKALSEYVDVGKEHSDGTPVQSLKWYETVLEHDKVKQLIAITITQKDKAAPAATVKMIPSERLEQLHVARANENGLYTE